MTVENAKPSEERHHLTVLDLFSGPGGMSQGIRAARNRGLRFRVLVANDNNNSVQSTYARNHESTEFVLGDITEESTKSRIVSAIREHTSGSTVDLVVGGPPCKGFSLENKMTRNMDNPMNHLVMHYAEMIRRTSPSAFIMENVPGIFAMRGGELVRDLIQNFKSLGYHNAAAWLLNAADYGVPQFRKRAFIVGSKSHVPIEKPKKTHGSRAEVEKDPTLKEYVNLGDAIDDLPEIEAGKSEPASNAYAGEPKNQFQRRMRGKMRRVANHVVTKNTQTVIERIKAVPPGCNWSSIPKSLMQVNGRYKKLEAHSMIYKRLLKSTPSITITNFRKAMIIHPEQHRLLSVREAARIQTFPDNFVFEGQIGSMQQQVSDAVPAGLAKKVGEAMLSHLHHVLGMMSVPRSARSRSISQEETRQ